MQNYIICHYLIFLYADLKQAVQQPVQPKADQKTAPAVETKASSSSEQKAPAETVQKVATTVEVKTTPTMEVSEDKSKQKVEDDSSLPKCIGPGCENNAQPDSVYCGNDCILRHAAAAMKSFSDVKEPKQKDKAKPQTDKSAAKVTWTARNDFLKVIIYILNGGIKSVPIKSIHPCGCFTLLLLL